MSYNLLWWMFLINSLSIFLPIGISIVNYKRFDIVFQRFSLYLYVTGGVEICAVILGKLGYTNLPLLHVYVIVQFGLLSLVYYLYFDKKILKQIISILIVVFTIFSICNSLFIQNILKFNTNARALESVFLIFYVLAYFNLIMQEMKIKFIEKEPLFWVSTGILLYYAGNLFLFIFSNYILPAEQITINMWIFHAVINLTLNSFFSIALWIYPKK